MKNKSDGFTSIECVVSLSIICTLVYMVSVSLYNNYFILNNNISKIEMTNIAKSTLDYIKESVRNKNHIIVWISKIENVSLQSIHYSTDCNYTYLSKLQ